MEGKEKMYSPKISEELIPYLYREAKEKREPMTSLINKIIKKHIGERSKKNEIINSGNYKKVA